ncbi:MAG: adenylate/guanylate cyclase domain-containing protein [Betaproteobacteria bacterium]|jgi:class 3 adenylate cyclase|nr:adenylate/guanylate cyclase domain-containing protein [Betaproteobacteria bacterium]
MENVGRTLVSSVLFLDIVEYSQMSVSEQLGVKQRFNESLKVALDPVAARDRVVLDTGDGAAVTFLGDPEDALFSAMAFRDATRELPVRLGINLGPVRLMRDVNGQINMIGDGINVAQRIMSFAVPNQLLVSRSFYEVVSCLSRDYASMFRYEGARTDKHVRAHEVYSVGGNVPASRRVAETAMRVAAPSGMSGWLLQRGLLGFQRSALLAAPLLFALFVGAGAALRPKAEPGSAGQVPALRERATISRPAAVASKPGSAAEEGKPAPGAAAKGIVRLAVAPWGAVFVDGERIGVSPPLRLLELDPGEHRIEIRNANFPRRIETVEVKPGGDVTIRHRFR